MVDPAAEIGQLPARRSTPAPWPGLPPNARPDLRQAAAHLPRPPAPLDQQVIAVDAQHAAST